MPRTPAAARLSLAALYAVFAAIATGVNIGTQALVHAALGDPVGLYVGILAGTGTGLVVKYLLDRRWIFAFTARSRVHEARTFVVYTLFSVVTTLIFWGTELAFQAIWGTATMRYAGAVLGLAVGYTAKYLLDRRFTFVDPSITRQETAG